MIDVYLHTSPSGRQYVGIASQGWRARWRSHVFDARHGSRLALHRAIRKYGPKAFRHELLERMSTRAGAERAEQLWIARLGTQTRGYNETAGGDGTHGLSADARARIGAAHRGKTLSPETRARVAAAQLGRKRGPHSPEHCARIAAAHRGKRLSDATREKLRAVNLGKRQTDETRAKRSAALKRAYAEGRRRPNGPLGPRKVKP